MNITIDSSDLLDILLEAGIQTVDAKALILDILTLQENSKKPPEQKPSAPVVKQQLRPLETRPQPETKAVYGDTVQEDQTETSANYEDEDDGLHTHKPTVTRVQGKSVGSRPKFDGFGGDSTGALRR